MQHTTVYEDARSELYCAERQVIAAARTLVERSTGNDEASFLDAGAQLIASVAVLNSTESGLHLDPSQKKAPAPGFFVVRQGLVRKKGSYLSARSKNYAGQEAILAPAWTTIQRRRAEYDSYQEAFSAAAETGGRVVHILKVPKRG